LRSGAEPNGRPREVCVTFSLIRCGADGVPLEPVASVPEALPALYADNAQLYRRIGFAPPWVSYVAVDAGQAVGGGAFVGAPRDNKVEIAYFTLPQFQGQSYATRTATQLLAIARDAVPGIVLVAFTLPENNPSATILRRLGFTVFGTARDADAGEVWEWRT
jgi:[ribosomal protein S5]-alanine N-acetyltransferase